MNALAYHRKNVWIHLNKEQKKEAFQLGERLKDYLQQSKTEREAVVVTKQYLQEKGFKPLSKIEGPLVAGDKIYQDIKGKALIGAHIGSKPITNGIKIIGAHIDSPRLDLKVHPLYESNGLALLKTHYYGGIKKYQWPAIPLSLHGVIYKADGEKVDICLGEAENDPVFTITDLLPHLAKNQLTKKADEVISGEDLNALCGSLPIENNADNKEEIEEKVKVKEAVLLWLNEHYGIIEEDFVSAELELIPALSPKDVGLDRSLVGAYGQDDRSCAFGALEALTGLTQPEHTAMVILADKEEIGSVGNTGMEGNFFTNCLAELIARQTDTYNELLLRRALNLSQALSSDVNVAVDPGYEEVMEKNNSACLGYGLVLTKYTGSGGKKGANDASAEFMSQIRNLFNINKVIWQTGELGKVDQGGGGTIAYLLANLGIEVVDCGIALLGMHSPYEVSHKGDIYMMRQGYQAFYNGI